MGVTLRFSIDPPVDGTKDDKSKSIKTRRVWSQKEEEALIRCLKEIIPLGWKADNGFRVGYLRELGKGLNKVDINARTMRNKSWPYYDDWCEIFCKDRGTGEHVKDITDVVNNMNSSKENTYSETGSQFNGPAYEVGDDADINDNTYVCDAEGDDTPKTRKRGRKRPSFDGETSSIITTLGGFLKNTDSCLGEIAKCIGYEQDVAISRKKVFQIIDTVQGLNMQQKLHVPEYFVLSNERLELFLNLPETARSQYV
ncbi:hypothetical protein ACS0TY_007599 [Phlomoides rotata]